MDRYRCRYSPAGATDIDIVGDRYIVEDTDKVWYKYDSIDIVGDTDEVVEKYTVEDTVTDTDTATAMTKLQLQLTII